MPSNVYFLVALRQVISDLSDPSEGVYAATGVASVLTTHDPVPCCTVQPASSFSSAVHCAEEKVLHCVALPLLVTTTHTPTLISKHHEPAAAMEERLGYTQRMLARHQKTTIIPEAGIGNQNRSNNAYFNRRPAGPESDDVAARNGSNGHNGNGAVALPVGSLPRRRQPAAVPAGPCQCEAPAGGHRISA